MPFPNLVARLEAIAGLSIDDRARIEGMPHIVRTLEKGEIFARQGDRLHNCCVIVSGFLGRQRIVAERNQMTSVYVPGDMPDLQTLHLPLLDRELCSIGATTLAIVPHVYLKEMLAQSAALTNAFWRETLIQAEIHRQWIDNLGSRMALARVAHLICEIEVRLTSVGLGKDKSFEVPLTQLNVAEACGISVVHTNRSIQQLRRLGLIEWQGPIVEIVSIDKLRELAEFSPSYLHLLSDPQAVMAR